MRTKLLQNWIKSTQKWITVLLLSSEKLFIAQFDISTLNWLNWPALQPNWIMFASLNYYFPVYPSKAALKQSVLYKALYKVTWRKCKSTMMVTQCSCLVGLGPREATINQLMNLMQQATHFALKHICKQMQKHQVVKLNRQLLHCYDRSMLAKSIFAS